MFSSPSPDGIDWEFDRLLKDDLVKEEQGVERLILGRSGDPFPYCQVVEVSLDLRPAHVHRVPLAMENDEAANPGDVALFGLEGIVPAPQDRPGLFDDPFEG